MEKCPEHEHEFEAFCLDDQTLVCIECAKFTHRKHKRIPVADVVF
jgi:hypothetical protein